MSAITNAFLETPSDMMVDVCVVGTGPGGSAAAKILAESGLSVVVLEAGKWHEVSTFNNDSTKSSRDLYYNHGKRVTAGNVNIPYLVGKGVGGGTLVNSGISFRTPRKTLERWSELANLRETTIEKLTPYMDEAEKSFLVEVIALDRLGRNNTIFHQGIKNLGWSGSVIPRNTVGCRPCARCYFGCPTGAKQSADKNFIPKARDAGAEIYYNARVEKLRVENDKIVEVLVHAVEPLSFEKKSEFRVRAKHFVFAAGAVGTSKLLLKQSLANSSGQVGKNFRCHPTVGVLGKFEEQIDGFKSILQGYYCDEFFDDDILLETVWAPAEAIATILPGVGADLMARMKDFRHYAMAGGMIRERGSGEVRVDAEGNASVKYNLLQEDFARLTRALYRSTEVLLAAGAAEVYSDNPAAPVIRSRSELQKVEGANPNLGPTIVLEGNHAQGTCRMNNNRKNGVVDEFGRSHDLANLWIMDGSVFPDAAGVNPQITITALALRNSRFLAAHF